MCSSRLRWSSPRNFAMAAILLSCSGWPWVECSSLWARAPICFRKLAWFDCLSVGWWPLFCLCLSSFISRLKCLSLAFDSTPHSHSIGSPGHYIRLFDESFLHPVPRLSVQWTVLTLNAFSGPISPIRVSVSMTTNFIERLGILHHCYLNNRYLMRNHQSRID